MNQRQKDLERERQWLIAQCARQRRRLSEDSAIARHWLNLARIVAISARRAARLYQYWNHSTQP